MIIDIAILVLVLVVSGVALYRKRSRGHIFALSLFSLIYFGFIKFGCLCPVGTVQNITTALSEGVLPKGIVVVLFIIPLFIALFAGRLFCGTACPLGAVQDVISLDRIKVPKVIDRILVLLPPLILYTVIIAVVRGDGYLLCRYDPFVSLFRFNAEPYLLIITMVFLAVTLFISRPFCRYLCPYGSILGVASLFSKWSVQIEPAELCISCKLCTPSCPVDVIRKGKRNKSGLLMRVSIVLSCVILIVVGYVIGEKIAIAGQWFFESEPLVIAEELLHRLTIAGRVMGVITSLLWSIEFASYFQRREDMYNPLKHRCVSCGRCYNHCPGEIKRIKRGEDIK